MIKRTLSSLVFVLSVLHGPVLLAERPAAEDETEAATSTDTTGTDTATDEARPASSDLWSQQPAETSAATEESTLPEVTEEPGLPEATEETPAPEVSAATGTVSEKQQSGDALAIPRQQPSTQTSMSQQILDFPRRGMSQEKVQNELGRPSEIMPAVGQPPITRWVYDDRIVYFEYDKVIHVVAK